MAKKAKKRISETRLPILPLQCLLFASPWLLGLYFEWTSAVASLALCGMLAWCMAKNKALTVPKSATLLAATIIVLFYALSPLWAVDKGMAVFGLVKFLPLPLFVLALAQTDEAERSGLFDINVLPLSAAIMTALSLGMSLHPSLKYLVTFNGRICGFLQYPNSFGAFLTLAAVCVMLREKLRLKSGIVLAILFFGVAASGSRSAFLLLIVCVLVCLLCTKNRKLRIAVLALMAALVAAVGLYALVSDNTKTIARFFTLHLSSGSISARLLYVRDALPALLRHPLGLGYLGYHFTYPSFQTGVYSLTYVHNDFVQLVLDIGWIPLAALLFALIKSLLRHRRDALRCLLILALCAHALTDFDLQYICMDFLLLAAMGVEAEKSLRLTGKGVFAAVGGLAAALSLYFGSASAAYYFTKYEAALELYPAYTEAMVVLLPRTETVADMESLADRILRLDDHVSLAHSAKARAAYSYGDADTMIREKLRAIECARYSPSEYRDYLDMLKDYYDAYTENGDTASAEVCRERILEVPGMIGQALDDLSDGAKKPELELKGKYLSLIEQLQ